MTEQLHGHVLYYPPEDKFIVKDVENGMKWAEDITQGLHDLSAVLELSVIVADFIKDNAIDKKKLVFVAYSRIGSLYRVRHLEAVEWYKVEASTIKLVG
jgi:hypothetical protein